MEGHEGFAKHMDLEGGQSTADGLYKVLINVDCNEILLCSMHLHGLNRTVRVGIELQCVHKHTTHL